MKRITAGDAESQSVPLADENLSKLRALFPEAVTEDGVNVDVLNQLVGKTTSEADEKYGLNWFGKRRARQFALTPSTGTLRPCREESLDWDSTRNLMIEGDNLEVLKLLQKSYSGRVRLIYIDPPYNTGNEFIYPDKYQDNLATYLRYTGQVDDEGFKLSANTETSGRYHTNWLNMMYPRLKLARNLLRADGAIFVSIDDHEVQNLRAMMDEVFGPENFIATVIWQKVYSPKNTAKHFSEDHDYVAVYARSADTWRPELLPRTSEQDAAYSNPDDDPRGPWKASDLSARNYYGAGTYSITCPSGRTIEGPPPGTYWRYSKEKFSEMDADSRIWWGQEGDNTPAVKRFLSEVKQGRVPQTLWTYQQVGHNQEAKKELLKRLAFSSSDSVFDTPKPTRMIQQILRIGTRAKEDDIVVDFFAGSGSTGDAVMQLNAVDNGNRRFILVQLPEHTGSDDYKTIAETTKARLRAAAQAVGEGADDKTTTIDLGFRVFKLDASNIKAWEPDRDDLEKTILEHLEHIREGRSEEDVLHELLLKLGLDLCVPIETQTVAGKTVHSIGAGTLFACLDTAISGDEVEPLGLGIAEWHAVLTPSGETTVVFRDSAFGNDVAKTNLAAILQQHGLETVRSL